MNETSLINYNHSNLEQLGLYSILYPHNISSDQINIFMKDFTSVLNAVTNLIPSKFKFYLLIRNIDSTSNGVFLKDFNVIKLRIDSPFGIIHEYFHFVDDIALRSRLSSSYIEERNKLIRNLQKTPYFEEMKNTLEGNKLKNNEKLKVKEGYDYITIPEETLAIYFESYFYHTHLCSKKSYGTTRIFGDKEVSEYKDQLMQLINIIKEIHDQEYSPNSNLL